jgi:RNA polymerase sigma factor (sigma-70 family)
VEGPSNGVERTAQAALRDADDALVDGARRGDAAAYAVLVERYQDVAFRVAALIVGDAAEAEDATQEAFIKAYYALPRFRVGAPFRPWLLQIVANQARNQRRAGGRRGDLALRASSTEAPEGDSAASPEMDALAEESRQALLQAVRDLRDDDRLVVAYRYFFDLSETEMATALGCARGTVKSRLSRALGRLRTGLLRVGLAESGSSEAARG